MSQNCKFYQYLWTSLVVAQTAESQNSVAYAQEQVDFYNENTVQSAHQK